MTNSFIKRYAILLLSIYLTQCTGSKVAHSCDYGNDYMQQRKEVKNSLMDMMTTYNENCLDQNQCTITAEPVHTYLTYDFSYYAELLAYSKLKTTCEEGSGYKMCQVNSKTVFQEDTANGEMNSYVNELNKPICFPPSCSLNQVGILDPTPATCNSSGRRKCQVLNYEVNCPHDFSTLSDTSTCSRDALPPTSSFYMQRSLIEASAMTSCKGALSTKDSDSCSIEVGKSSAMKEMEWLNFKSDPSYLHYQKTCAKWDGQICYVDMEIDLFDSKNKVHNITFGDIIITHKYKNYPHCMPVTCRGDDLAAIAIKNYANENDINCDPYSNGCNITVSKVSCLGYLNTLNKQGLSETPNKHDFVSPSVISEVFPSGVHPEKESEPSHVESIAAKPIETIEYVIPTPMEEATVYPEPDNNKWTFWHTFLTVSGIILFFTLLSFEE